ncbi:hypothetical protein [uncultured Sulfitobacter sp.]|uniref:hypothetical protein n=1 Tax=uncultured Sulfitobacter sp. TaxID=191468 RepID=UPI00260832B4|nr:hypothetical protein [uncultured Sulfitobacter sp.]
MSALLAEAFNFIAIPFVIAVIQFVLFASILRKAGLPRWTSLFTFVPVFSQIGIYLGGGWITFYQVLGPIPLVIPLYQIAMVLISFVALFVLVFARWPVVATR